ncbi:hypothetical protein AABB24_018509, partial [Solanum stoloniferum]
NILKEHCLSSPELRKGKYPFLYLPLFSLLFLNLFLNPPPPLPNYASMYLAFVISHFLLCLLWVINLVVYTDSNFATSKDNTPICLPQSFMGIIASSLLGVCFSSKFQLNSQRSLVNCLNVFVVRTGAPLDHPPPRG